MRAPDHRLQLGRHDDALRILALDLQDSAGAEDYCKHPERYGLVRDAAAASSTATTDADLRRDLFLRLLKVYLSDHGYV